MEFDRDLEIDEGYHDYKDRLIFQKQKQWEDMECCSYDVPQQ